MLRETVICVLNGWQDARKATNTEVTAWGCRISVTETEIQIQSSWGLEYIYVRFLEIWDCRIVAIAAHFSSLRIFLTLSMETNIKFIQFIDLFKL